jgi:maltose alpha-D-glucosyltransferase/alpha-amylase
MAGGKKRALALAGNPLWFKDAIFYEARVRSFCDSDGDGIGDFRGFTQKLDYLQDLGITAIWLLPFYPSPLRDDGYDISDYLTVHPDCGTLNDFKVFLREAHRRDLRVITELVINHTSDQHPWFQRARRAPAGSKWRNFYVWSDTREKYKGTRIIFKDFELSNWTWDPVAKAYYWHRFFSHQPDLNYESPDVQKAVFDALDFWLQLGVDGLRLDAIPYLYEQEGTGCENLPETHVFLRKLRKHVDENFADRMLLAEANQWPEDAVPYFGDGDECHMSFHFPIMPRLFMALHMEDRFPIIDILEQTPPIPDNCQWALFLRNHDELTLEMVTDEERDYMYRVYAHDQQARINLGIRRRLAPLLGNDRRRIEVMNALLFSLPGTPIIYYGDEIGMGDNFYLGDRNGVRTPMQWSPDRNAGFSQANPQRLYLPVIIDPEYNYETVNVESQRSNLHSLWWWTKRLIALRRRYRAFGRGTMEFLAPNNRKVLAFIRRYEDETILVVVNLSRFVQFVELDLAQFRGQTAVELFGRTEFPPIGELPYLLTLGPHAFYWFGLEASRATDPAHVAPAEQPPVPPLAAKGTWESLLRDEGKASLERILPNYLAPRRWFGSKTHRITRTVIVEQMEIPLDEGAAFIAFVRVDFADAPSETYVLPLAFAAGKEAQRIRDNASRAMIAQVRVRTKAVESEGILYDATEDAAVAAALLDAIAKRKILKGASGDILCRTTAAFRELRGPNGTPLAPSTLKAEQSNTSIIYGNRLLLKLFRRLGEGINPDVEVSRFLTERTSFSQIAPVAGWMEYQRPKSMPVSLAILQAYVANEGDAWHLMLDEIHRYLEHALTRSEAAPLQNKTVFELTREDPPPLALELLGAQLEMARLLGRRTAEMHLALASAPAEDPDFAAEELTGLYQRSLYQSMRNLIGQVFRTARDRLKHLPEGIAAEVRDIVAQQPQILKTFQELLDLDIQATRIRCHGDYHLGQVLYTGKDFVITDFEGEPARSLSERRRKRSPLQDVAGMIRSFDYAAQTALARGVNGQPAAAIEPWVRLWYAWASSAFLRAYLRAAGEASFLPRSAKEQEALLRVFLLEKSIYELGYELNNRPDWVAIPLRGIRELLRANA